MAGNALIVCIPLTGHLAPLLQQAHELVRRGWQVRVASTEEFRRHFENEAEVEFVSVGSGESVRPSLQEVEAYATLEPDFLKSSVAMVKWTQQLWPVMFDGVMKAIRAKRPNVIVADIVSLAGVDAADVEGIPLVVNNPCVLTVIPVEVLPPSNKTPLLFSNHSIRQMGLRQKLTYPLIRALAPLVANASLGREMNMIRATRGLPPSTYTRRLSGTMILTNTAFGLEYDRPLNSLQYLVGPQIPENYEALPAEFERWLAGGPAVVFVNMGTVAAPSSDLLKRLLSGLTQSDFRVLWVLRSSAREFLPAQLPENIRMESWVSSQIGVLQHPNVRAFVSHCGVNSAHESVLAGKPVVGIPLLADQKDMAQRLVDAGVCVMLDKTSFTAEQLKASICEVIREGKYTMQMPVLRAAFKAAGGVGRAADLIEQTSQVPSARYLAFYDGVCGLCNWTVQFMIRVDYDRIINYAPLQGDAARTVLGRHRNAPKDLSTMAYVRNAGRVSEQIYYRSDAVLQMLRDICGFWRVISWLRIVPRFIRDWIYNCVASSRYTLFGKYSSCPVPDAKLRERFLN